MITIKRYAAIDIGSNAMRLLVSNIVEQEGKDTQFNKSSLVRVPIRLGQDVFTVGEISDENIERMIDAMKAYKLLMKVHRVEQYKACATSAMREADNNRDIVEIIQHEADIHIDIIDGKKEAAIIASSDLKEYIATDKTYLYVDVGGGSTELTLYHKSNIILQKSFNIGTVRILTKKVKDETWDEMKEILKELSKKFENIIGIGSGGNINKLFSISGAKAGKSISYETLKDIYKEMEPLAIDERMKKYTIKEDRAEVIVPALTIYNAICKWSNISEIHVPKIGLADGLIHHLYDMVIHD